MSLWRSFRIASIGTLLSSPVVVFAQNALSQPIVPANCTGADAATKCGICDLALLAQNILNAAIYIMIVLSAVMFAWAGLKALTSGGNVAEYGAAKRIFGNVLVGLIIILMAWVLIDTVMRTLVGNNAGYGRPWNKICQSIEHRFERAYV